MGSTVSHWWSPWVEEEPIIPSASRMVEILAENPVAQAKFFIISMRLFLEHVLGVMPFDEQLRDNGSRAGVIYADGAAGSFTGRAATPLCSNFLDPLRNKLVCHAILI